MVNQLLFNGIERENLYECPQCSEAITNPLCHDCLGDGVKQWLGFYPDIKKKIVPQLGKYIKEINNLTMASLNCVSCNKKKAALCPYCFTEGVYHLLKKNKVNVHVMGDFLTVFNFDLEKAGYIKDAIEDNIY